VTFVIRVLDAAAGPPSVTNQETELGKRKETGGEARLVNGDEAYIRVHVRVIALGSVSQQGWQHSMRTSNAITIQDDHDYNFIAIFWDNHKKYDQL